MQRQLNTECTYAAFHLCEQDYVVLTYPLVQRQRNTEYIYVAFHLYELNNVVLGLMCLQRQLDTECICVASHLWDIFYVDKGLTQLNRTLREGQCSVMLLVLLGSSDEGCCSSLLYVVPLDAGCRNWSLLQVLELSEGRRGGYRTLQVASFS